MKKHAIVLLLTLLLMLLACGETQDTADLETTIEEPVESIETSEEVPRYQTRGITADGASFSGTVTIVETEVESTYQITWFNGSVAAYQGVGMDYGPDLMIVGAEGPLLDIFRKTDNGYAGIFFNGELGIEVISAELNQDPLPEPADIVALQPWPESYVFEVSGTNPDGSEYTGILQTQALGDGAVVLWTHDGGGEISGGALMLDDGTIVAAFSIGVVVYELIEEDIWRGEWYSPGSEALGVEWITPL